MCFKEEDQHANKKVTKYANKANSSNVNSIKIAKYTEYLYSTYYICNKGVQKNWTNAKYCI